MVVMKEGEDFILKYLLKLSFFLTFPLGIISFTVLPPD